MTSSESRGDLNSQKYPEKRNVIGEATVIIVVGTCATFVGGPNFLLIILSSLLIARMIAPRVGTALGVCIGIITTLFTLLLEFLTLIPLLKRFEVTRGIFFVEQRIIPFVARETVFENLIELNRVSSMVITGIPLLIAAICLIVVRPKTSSRFTNPSILGVVFLPLLLAAIRKAQDSLSYLVSTASGDGRNFFLLVQKIRATSSFTNLGNFTSQGDFSASLSSLLSDGFGSDGLFRFMDQYSVAALYVLFGVLISTSAIATTIALSHKPETFQGPRNPEWSLGVLVVVSIGSIQMPWVMNEMFRSGFFSAVAAMSICATAVAICVSNLLQRTKFILLLLITLLAFAVYQISAIYPILMLIVSSFPHIGKFLRRRPFRTSLVLIAIALLIAKLTPRILDQLQSRLALEGSIVYLTDRPWLPIALSGAAMAFVQGKIRSIGIQLFAVGFGTAIFQLVASELRENNGQQGYGYYGAKFAYIGLFIVLLIVMTSLGSLFLSSFSQQERSERNSRLVSRLLVSSSVILFVVALSKFVVPTSRGFYGDSSNWTQPTKDGLRLSLSYWDYPRVIFSKISDPGNDVITNFWHPYFWSGKPWEWAYRGELQDIKSICAFAEGTDVLIVTGDQSFADEILRTCVVRVVVR